MFIQLVHAQEAEVHPMLLVEVAVVPSHEVLHVLKAVQDLEVLQKLQLLTKAMKIVSRACL